jgi:regulator of replication initiation timing
VTAQAVAARNAAGEAISRLENDNRNLAQQLETSKGLANEALEHAKKLVAENKELRQRASASSQPTPTIGQLVSALGRIETSEKSSPVLARFAKLLREEGEKLAKIEDSRVKKDGPLELTMSDLQSLFDPLRPITILDVPPAEVARYLHLLNLFEDLRRGLLDYLGTQGFRPIRPIPNIDRFDAALHEEIPNLRRPTADKKLVDIIANRATTGVQVMNDDGTYSAALKAQVGRFVFTEASGPTTAH